MHFSSFQNSLRTTTPSPAALARARARAAVPSALVKNAIRQVNYKRQQPLRWLREQAARKEEAEKVRAAKKEAVRLKHAAREAQWRREAVARERVRAASTRKSFPKTSTKKTAKQLPLQSQSQSQSLTKLPGYENLSRYLYKIKEKATIAKVNSKRAAVAEVTIEETNGERAAVAEVTIEETNGERAAVAEVTIEESNGERAEIAEVTIEESNGGRAKATKSVKQEKKENEKVAKEQTKVKNQTTLDQRNREIELIKRRMLEEQVRLTKRNNEIALIERRMLEGQAQNHWKLPPEISKELRKKQAQREVVMLTQTIIDQDVPVPEFAVENAVTWRQGLPVKYHSKWAGNTVQRKTVRLHKHRRRNASVF